MNLRKRKGFQKAANAASESDQEKKGIRTEKPLRTLEQELEEQLATLDGELCRTLGLTLAVYLDYLTRWVDMASGTPVHKNVLEQEWLFVRAICPHVPGGEAAAGRTFAAVAASMLRSAGQWLSRDVRLALASPSEPHNASGEPTANLSRWKRT